MLSRLSFVYFVVLASYLLFVSLPADAVTITEFTVPTADSGLAGITSGPDGNLWFTEVGGNKIGQITTSGVITEFPVLSAGLPTGIAAGPDGNLWFTEFNGNRIGRITTAGVITEFAVPTAFSAPWGITSGPDGNLWFTEPGGNKIGQITTAGVITEFTVPTANSSLIDITVGPDGNLWFTEADGNKIGQITTSGIITEFIIPSANSRPFSITAGPDGNLWFTEYNGNRIGRITTAGVITEFTVPSANSGPLGITSGPDGNVWFTENGGNRIGLITTAGVITEFTVPSANSGPAGITSGPDGNVWFTEANGWGKIGRVSQTLSGNIRKLPSLLPFAGVLVALSGDATATTTTDTHGNYALPISLKGNYTVLPTYTGYFFKPPYRNISEPGTDVTGQNFAGTYTGRGAFSSISGKVSVWAKLNGYKALSNVTINLTGTATLTTTTDASGNYAFTGLPNGSYTISPVNAGYTFTPASRHVAVSGANVANQNFIGNIGGGLACLYEDFSTYDLATNWDQYPSSTWTISNGHLNSTYAGDQFIANKKQSTDVTEFVYVDCYDDCDTLAAVFRFTDSSSAFYTVYGNSSSQLKWYVYSNTSSLAGQAGDNLTSGSTIASFGLTVLGTGASTTVRVWFNPTAHSPTSATSWDSREADASTTNDLGTYADTGKKGGAMSNASGHYLDAWAFGDAGCTL